MNTPLYHRIADQLRTRIASGVYPLDSRLPTENELSGQLGASRPTVRQALDMLAREGLVTKVKGSGTFVSQPKLIHESTSFISGYREESQKKHRTLHTQVLLLQEESAEGRIAEALRITPGTRVTRLIRVRWLENVYNGAPVVYTTVYVPVELFPDMVQVDFTNTSLYEKLEELGQPVIHASRRLEVVMPDAEAAVRLEISAFEPVIYIASRGLTHSGLVVEFAESFYPASRSSFQIEIQKSYP